MGSERDDADTGRRTWGYVLGAAWLFFGLVTMVDGRTRLSADVDQELRRHLGELVFKTSVPRSVRLAEAPSYGLPAIAYDRRSPGAEAYWKVAMELVERS